MKLKLRRVQMSERMYHRTHLVGHLTYLGLVTVHSSYYGIAAGILGGIVILGEVVEIVHEKEK